MDRPHPKGDREPGPRHHDTRAFYDRLARIYDRLSSAEAHVRLRAVNELAPEQGDTVLEIGSATGSVLTEMTGRVGEHGLVLGLDLSHGMLRVASERLGAWDHGRRAVLAQADARSLPLADHCLDVAMMSFTLELFEESEIPRVLGEVRRVLKPAGRLAVVALDSTLAPGPLAGIYRWFHERFPSFVDCRPIAVTAVLAEAGLTVVVRVPMTVWSLPVVVAIARAPGSPTPADPDPG